MPKRVVEVTISTYDVEPETNLPREVLYVARWMSEVVSEHSPQLVDAVQRAAANGLEIVLENILTSGRK